MTYRRPSLFWPIIFIGVGVIFLLSNLNIIQGNPWPTILRLWPVLLIMIGLDIIFGRRSAVGSIISTVLALVVVGGIVLLLIGGVTFGNADLQTKQVSSPLGDIRSANVSIDFSTGENQLYALSDSSNLIEGDIRYYGTLNFLSTGSGNQASVQLSSSDAWFQAPFLLGDGSQQRWNIGLNPQATYDVDLNMGVGHSTVDLSKLTLSGGQIDMGVGEVDLRLPTSSSFRMTINGGVGKLNLHVPGRIGLHVEVDKGLGSFNTSPRLRSIGRDVYETDGFSSAAHQVTLILHAGVGSLDVFDGE